MAGIGVKLNRIFEKRSIAANLAGFAYSTMVTIAPMFIVIANIILMSYVLGYEELSYARRGLLSGTLLYIFIFSLLTAAPFNAVLSRYMSDIIYNEKYEDILPCFYVGLLMNIVLSCLVGIPFCIWERLVGRVHLLFVFTGFCGYISLVLVFYSMLYLSICKDYQKISGYFVLGMIAAFFLSLLFVKVFHREIAYSMLLSLTCGFFLTASFEIATIKRYFKRNSNRYRPVISYFKKYWKLIFSNFFYTLGLYIHNFVFWNTDLGMTVAHSFVYAPSYDLATCLAMFTNLSATIIFIARVEMKFHGRYKTYSEAVIGGRWVDICNAKERMFRQLSSELLSLARIQFILSIVIYLFFMILLPRYGYSGPVLQMYPCLAAGFFILFLLYAEIIFLYYFNDNTGALLVAAVFCLMNFLGALVAKELPVIWYGIGLVFGSFCGFTFGYFRLRWVERHMDEHVFCQGILFPVRYGKKPAGRVYDRTMDNEKGGEMAQ
ncbi:MAG: exopolysaccharide Pel transporter PelG [Roseburia sp.]